MTTQDPQNVQPPAPPTPPQYTAPAAAGQPVYYQRVQPTNTLAIVAFVLAFFVSIAAIICGHIALGQIKRTGEGGHGLALAAVILGYTFLGLGLLLGIIYAIIIVAAVSSGSFSSYSG